MELVLQIAFGVALGYLFIQILRLVGRKLLKLWVWFTDLNAWVAVALMFTVIFLVGWLLTVV